LSGDDRVGVESSAASVVVDVRKVGASVPVARVGVAADLLRGRQVGGGASSIGSLEVSGSESEGVELRDGGEERVTLNLLPEIEGGLLPVLNSVIEIVLDQSVDFGFAGGSRAGEELDVLHEGESTKRRSITLRSARESDEVSTGIRKK